MKVDRRFWPLLLELRSCLCDALKESSPEHELCQCLVVPGIGPDPSAALSQKKGMAWVRLVNSYPSTSPPSPSSQMLPCHPQHAAQVEIGVLRCYPVPGPRGVLSAEVVEEAAELQMSDMAAMVRAVCCTERDHVLGSYTPDGPAGGLYGGTWTVYFPQDDIKPLPEG